MIDLLVICGRDSFISWMTEAKWQACPSTFLGMYDRYPLVTLSIGVFQNFFYMTFNASCC